MDPDVINCMLLRIHVENNNNNSQPCHLAAKLVYERGLGVKTTTTKKSFLTITTSLSAQNGHSLFIPCIIKPSVLAPQVIFWSQATLWFISNSFCYIYPESANDIEIDCKAAFEFNGMLQSIITFLLVCLCVCEMYNLHLHSISDMHALILMVAIKTFRLSPLISVKPLSMRLFLRFSSCD